MGCPAEVDIGASLVFSVCTHDPTTGALTDAAAVPAYLVYEDETGTAILSGNMAKLDDALTTGFYSEQLACTSANGFEDNKTYTVYITATVAGVEGGISYGFRAKTPVWGETIPGAYSAGSAGYILGHLNIATITVTSAVSGSTITIVRGDTVSVAIAGLGNLTGNSKVWFTVKTDYDQADTAAILQVEKTGGLLYLNGAAATTATNASLAVDVVLTGDITITLKAATTSVLLPRAGLLYDVQWLDGSGHIHTLTYGTCNVVGTPDITRAIA